MWGEQCFNDYQTQDAVCIYTWFFENWVSKDKDWFYYLKIKSNKTCPQKHSNESKFKATQILEIYSVPWLPVKFQSGVISVLLEIFKLSELQRKSAEERLVEAYIAT